MERMSASAFAERGFRQVLNGFGLLQITALVKDNDRRRISIVGGGTRTLGHRW